jgi:outer membrane usher protein
MKNLTKVILVAASTYTSAVSAETLYLDVYLNGVQVNQLIEFNHIQNHFWSSEDVLGSSSLAEYASGLKGRVDYCNLQAVTCDYSYETQRLYLTADIDLFPAQVINSKKRTSIPITRSSGALVNYDIYYRDYQSGTTTVDLLQQWRAFGDWGVFETTANYRKELGGSDSSTVDEGMIRYDSYWQYNDEENMRYWRVGDMISAGNPWARQVRMGGIKLSRRFELDPQYVSYPYPEFIGSAVLPSDVEVFVNNYKMYSGNVEPGNFILDSEPTVNGFASASIVTTDINGQAVSRDLQFYVAPDLLKQGVYDYDLNLGVLRQGFGLDSFDYDSNLTAIADVRYGLTDYMSVSSHAELSKDVYNVGFGTDFTLGNLGVFSFAAAHGQDKNNSGWLGLAGYRFQANNWGFSAQVKQQQQGYRDTGSTQFVSQIEREVQANAAYSFDNGVSVGVGYFDITKFDDDDRRLVSAFYNQSIDTASISASVNWDPDRDDVSVGLNFSIPFGTRSRASVSHVRDNKGEDRTVASASFARNGNRGFRGNVSNVVGTSDFSANGSWRGDKVELTGGYYNRGGSSGHWGQASGSLIWSKSRFLLGNRVADTFAVVSTGGIADVPVLIENQEVGESDDDGMLLVTGLASYNPVNISINTKSLPLDTNVVNDQIQVMAAESHGVDVDFELYQTKAAIVIVNDEQDQPIPVGALATLNGEQNGDFVGWDGELYLEKLQDNNTLTLIWDGKQCVLEFAYSKQEDDIPVIGPLVCAPEVANALVMINDQQGQPVPAGTLAIINDQLEPQVVGKNGQLSLSSLTAQNIVTLNWADQQCSAEFTYRKTDEQTPVIGPITCEPKQFIATVIVNDSKGNPIPAGASAIINSDEQPQTVAHHGEVYPQALQAQNQMILQWDNKQCSVEFSYTQINHQKAIIGPLVCQHPDSMANVTSPETQTDSKPEMLDAINTVAIDVQPSHTNTPTHADEQTHVDAQSVQAKVNTQASVSFDTPVDTQVTAGIQAAQSAEYAVNTQVSVKNEASDNGASVNEMTVNEMIVKTQAAINTQASVNVNTQALAIEQHQHSINLEYISAKVQQVASQLTLTAQTPAIASTTHKAAITEFSQILSDTLIVKAQQFVQDTAKWFYKNKQGYANKWIIEQQVAVDTAIDATQSINATHTSIHKAAKQAANKQWFIQATINTVEINRINEALITKGNRYAVNTLRTSMASMAYMPNAPNRYKQRRWYYASPHQLKHHGSKLQQAPPQRYLMYQPHTRFITQQSKGETV